MKKLSSLLLLLCMMVSLLAACAQPADPGDTADEPTQEEAVTIRVGGLTGPTSMGMVQLMDADEKGESANDYDFTLAGAADALTPELIQGNLDMAAIPANLAAVLYQNTEGALQVLAVNTLGVLYIVEKGGESIQSLSDLAGATIYASGKGSTPEYTLRHLLSSAGIDPDTDVTIEWKSEAAEAVAALGQAEQGVAMLPQPYVTAAQAQVEGLRIALDLTQAWNEQSADSSLITGVLVARRDFVEAHPQAVEAFLGEYAASIAYSQENVAEAAQLIEHFGIIKAAVAEKALPYCNLTFLSGSEMQEALGGYLAVLYDQNPNAVGGALPDDDFYYGA